MNIYEKLCKIQCELKAPKNQFNKFGNYNYRSLEDISEAIKPLLSKYKVTMTICDTPVAMGDRMYIQATATLIDYEKPEDKIINTAYAMESLTKKGMDDSQITGATSSYARKYCLNGLFCIDDCRDPDSMDNSTHETKAPDLSARFIKRMKELKKDYPQQYKEVMDNWKDDGKDLDPAKITNLQTQKDIVNDITSRIGKAA